MKKQYNLVIAVVALVLTYTASSGQAGYFGNYFTHQCMDSTQFQNYTLLYSSELNNDSNAIAIMTPHSLLSGLAEDFHCGMYYNKTLNRWAIYSEQGYTDTMPLLSGFNVLVPTTNGTVLKHKATALNTTGNKTLIDDPATNAKPNALLYITHNWGVSGGVYNNRATGVYYDPTEAKWGIYNENQAAFPIGATYNVLVVEAANANAFIYTTGTPPVSAKHICYMDVPSINGNDDIRLFVTHNLSPGGVTNNKYDTATIGVANKSSDWLFYNRDRSRIDSGTTFNILVANNLPNTSIEQSDADDANVLVYPNPAQQTIYINTRQTSSDGCILNIFNMTGAMVKTAKLSSPSQPVNVADLGAGIYVAQIQNSKQLYRQKIVIE